MHKLHSKFRFSKNCNTYSNKQCILIFKACKLENDITQTLLNARDRGGLWKIKKKIQDIILNCEIIFISNAANFTTLLICKDLVDKMMKNIIIMSNFNSIYSGIYPKIRKIISLNLLEHMLTLFVSVRSFSYGKEC